MLDWDQEVNKICRDLNIPEVDKLVIKKKQSIISSPKYSGKKGKIKLYEKSTFKNRTEQIIHSLLPHLIKNKSDWRLKYAKVVNGAMTSFVIPNFIVVIYFFMEFGRILGLIFSIITQILWILASLKVGSINKPKAKMVSELMLIFGAWESEIAEKYYKQSYLKTLTGMVLFLLIPIFMILAFLDIL